MNEEQDWAAWSQEAVRLMQTRNRAFNEKFGLAGRPYRWHLEHAQTLFFTLHRFRIVPLKDVAWLTEASDAR